MPLDTAKLTALATQIQADSAEILSMLAAAQVTVVKAGEDLQAACDAGGTIQYEDGATFEGNLVLRTPGTALFAAKAMIHGPTGAPALFIPPGTSDISAVVGTILSDWDQYAVLVGTNDDKQTTVDLAPSNITLTVNVPTFRGKHAIGVHGRNVILLDCNVADTYSPAGADSQAIGIVNAPGPVIVQGGSFSAGSEIILVGGDVPRIPGLTPDMLTFKNLTLSRPLTWKTDGVKRVVKNIFELKTGTNVLVEDVVMDGCWKDGQDGFAIVITPRFGLTIGHLTFRRVTARNVAAGINMIGYDNVNPGPQVVDVTFDTIDVTTDPTFGAGARPFLQITSSPDGVGVINSTFHGNGTTIYTGVGTVWAPDGTKIVDGTVTNFVITGNMLAVNSYGLMTQFGAYGASYTKAWPNAVIDSNAFIGTNASKMKPNLPLNNTYAAA